MRTLTPQEEAAYRELAAAARRLREAQREAERFRKETRPPRSPNRRQTVGAEQ